MAEHWITVENGQHVLIEGSGNEYKIVGGAGGKLNGTKVSPSSMSKARSFKIPEGHHRLSNPAKVERETEKAYGISNPDYEEAKREHEWGGNEAVAKRASQAAHEAWQERRSLIWLPKSHTTAHEGHVVTAAEWLARKQGLPTIERQQNREAAFEAGKQRYQQLLEQARSAGVPGVRERMKTATIKQKMREHGLSVQDAATDDELDWDIERESPRIIRASGAMLVARTGKALFLRRADTGLWAFPGGHIEDGETAEQAAEREIGEEIGPAAYDALKPWTRRIRDDGQGEVDFTTFAGRVNDEFIPALNEEHTAWTWADINDPPQPLHPGIAVALARFGMDELGVARAMAAGDLTSPQRYGSFWLWAIRITGTGAAYRDAHDEYCWRPGELYLTEDFLARCNGLPVVFIHPQKKPKLDSEEFHKRIVGTVFVPFMRGDEIWAIAKIYDDDAVAILQDEQFSTSPGVVFGPDSGNQTLRLKDGTNLLIEGKPALLDHIALVPAGVWDKGGAPSGVETRNDATLAKEPIGMAEKDQADADKARNDSNAKLDAIMDVLGGLKSRMDAIEDGDRKREDARRDAARFDAARKDRFGARKDGESFKDWGKRHDADEAAMCDAMRADGCDEEKAKADSARARKDAEDAERKDGGESFEKWAKEEEKEPEHKGEKDARKDADVDRERMEREEREKRADAARHDAQTAEVADLKRQLAALTARFTPVSAEERNALAMAQSRADGIAGLFGQRASAPVPGETAVEYRRRLAGEFKQHSPKLKDKSLASLDADMLGMVEEQIYADAASAARSPDRAGIGVLIPIREPDETGRVITRYTGDNMAWMQFFMSPSRVGKFIEPRRHV